MVESVSMPVKLSAVLPVLNKFEIMLGFLQNKDITSKS